MDECKVMQVIYCSKKRVGTGNNLSPIRVVYEIFDFNGNLLMDNDPFKIYTDEDMVKFANKCKELDIAPEELIRNFR